MSTELLYVGASLTISITVMVLLTRYAKLHAFFSLLAAAFVFGLFNGQPVLTTLTSMQSGFGSLLQQIGLLVAIGSCLGIVMEKTGAMQVIGHKIASAFGTQYTVLSMTVMGLLVGIPVFCDSGFIILSRLVPTLATQASVSPAQLYLALSSGLYTTHTLVPPTPGPLAAAANLNLSDHIGIVILMGVTTSLPVGLVSYYFSRKLGFKVVTRAVETNSLDMGSRLASWKAFAPLLIPILLIAFTSFGKLIDEYTTLSFVLNTIGNPVLALLLGLAIAFSFVAREQRGQTPVWLAEALRDAGVILLITGAGGAFGAVIKSSGIDLLLKEQMATTDTSGVLFLLVGYLIAAILKTAQGSTTSALIIASSILMPLASSAGFQSPIHLSILLVALGGGAMSVSHGNDSYFWVVTQFGGFESRDSLRTFTWITLLQGLTAFLTSILLFVIL
jgi:GntP family gluconate:H+ symporter